MRREARPSAGSKARAGKGGAAVQAHPQLRAAGEGGVGGEDGAGAGISLEKQLGPCLLEMSSRSCFWRSTSSASCGETSCLAAQQLFSTEKLLYKQFQTGPKLVWINDVLLFDKLSLLSTEINYLSRKYVKILCTLNI